MSGRTSWWAKDAAWHRRELIVELGEEFGAEGPMVVDVLWSWAQEQRSAGEVRGGFRILAREAFVTVCHAEFIVAKAAEIGAIDDLEIDADGRRFTCRVSGFRADQQRGRAAWRQAEKREIAGDSSETPPETEQKQSVTERDKALHVTPRHTKAPTRPDQTIETTPLPPQGEKPETTVPVRPAGGRKRELEVYDEQVAAFARVLFPDATPDASTAAVRSVLGRGHHFHAGDAGVVRVEASKYLPLRDQGVA